MENKFLVKLYNGTPHSINIIQGATLDSTDRKWKGGEIIQIFPPNGMLSAKINSIQTGVLNGLIPVFSKEIVDCQELPIGFDYYIVSVLYATAYKAKYGNTDKLLVVADPVMSEDGKTFIGCTGLATF